MKAATSWVTFKGEGLVLILKTEQSLLFGLGTKNRNSDIYLNKFYWAGLMH